MVIWLYIYMSTCSCMPFGLWPFHLAFLHMHLKHPETTMTFSACRMAISNRTLAVTWCQVFMRETSSETLTFKSAKPWPNELTQSHKPHHNERYSAVGYCSLQQLIVWVVHPLLIMLMLIAINIDHGSCKFLDLVATIGGPPKNGHSWCVRIPLGYPNFS